MNKDAENLIAALKSAFTYYDLIVDNGGEWSLDNLIDTIVANPYNDDKDNEQGKEYHAERGKVYEVDAQGYLGNLIYERKEETYGHYLDRNAYTPAPKGVRFSNSITPEQAEALRKLADEYDTSNATEEKGLYDASGYGRGYCEPRYLSGLQVVDIDDNPDHFTIEAIDFDGDHDFGLLDSLCEKAGIPESTREADSDRAYIGGYDGTRKCYALFCYTFHVARD